MSNAIFPQLPGVGWPVNKKPYFSTIVIQSAGGQETRIANYPFALEQFDLPINHLHGNAAVSPNLADFEQLWGFYIQRLGPWDSFLYFDPTDNNTVQIATNEGLSPNVGQNIFAHGDGSTTAFQLYRNLGGGLQPIFDINGITATGAGAAAPPIPTPFAKVYVAGGLLGSGWTISSKGMLTFTSPPANGATIAADFSFFKRCRFADDHLEFQNFMANLFKVSKIALRQVFA